MFDTSQLLAASGEAGFYDHPIEQSLRFNDDDSAYLTRTPSSAGNRKTWTWSGWVKRSSFGTLDKIFSAGTASTDMTFFETPTDGTFKIGHFNGATVPYSIKTTQVFRDTSAWYHVVLTFDTTQATASERMRLYINGDRVTALTATYPAQNTESNVNNAVEHQICNGVYNSTEPFDGYLAEVHFIDGQALDASSFGETKSGVWKPVAYTGSYGTNGFYLDFGNSGSIGADVSGNGNNWTANNLAATDVVLDSPTNNFATLNPLSMGSYVTLSEGNLKLTGNTSTDESSAGSSIKMNSGKYYAEFLCQSVGSGGNRPSYGAIRDWGGNFTNGQAYLSSSVTDNFARYASGGSIYNTGTTVTATTFTNGDIIGVAIDLDNGAMYFHKNGTWQNSGSPTSGASKTGACETWTATSDFFSFFSNDYYNSVSVSNFGQDSSFAGNKTAQGNTDDNGYGDFYYAPPTGYLALCTANLTVPDAMNPALDASPQDYFNTVLYTGNGSTNAITGVGFQPDFIWTKPRDNAGWHFLSDVIRGGTKVLNSNATDAEGTRANHIQSFDSDGFTLGADGTSNFSGSSLVAWNWKAGGTGVSNTDGSITSTVSANTDAGFSIVSYTGNNTSGATVGHGLSQAPEFYIVKNRSTAGSFLTYDKTNGATKYMFINGTAAAAAYSGFWNDTAPTSSVFSLGNDSNVNSSSFSYIAYCFHSVEGFSKFGSYTGNGSTDGVFIYTGFRPSFFMIKRTDSAGSWIIFDDKRVGYNKDNNHLLANDSAAEYTDIDTDIVSNGFKFRAGGGDHNGAGNTYIFMAFAENPFKYSTAR